MKILVSLSVTDVPLQLLGERVLRRSGGLGVCASPEVLLGGEAHRHDGVPVVLTQQPEQPRARPDALHFPLLMYVVWVALAAWGCLLLNVDVMQFAVAVGPLETAFSLALNKCF